MTTKTTLTTNKGEKVSQASLARRKKASPAYVELSVYNLDKLIKVNRSLGRHLKLKYEGVSCLLMIYSHWVRNNKGITLTGLCRALEDVDDSGALYERVRQRKDILAAKGLCECIGSDKRGNKLFAPTVRVMRELEGLVNVFALEVREEAEGSETKKRGTRVL